MAVISELIDAGLQLKAQEKHEAAIEHFRQLHETYPDNARVKFELAAAWSAFGVPEQALPLYRELLALPKRQGLPAKDMPRLYARLSSTLIQTCVSLKRRWKSSKKGCGFTRLIGRCARSGSSANLALAARRWRFWTRWT